MLDEHNNGESVRSFLGSLLLLVGLLCLAVAVAHNPLLLAVVLFAAVVMVLCLRRLLFRAVVLSEVENVV
jgi:predicted lysophospholipase L1 biosynthesis ABC-type transport system permease subunit